MSELKEKIKNAINKLSPDEATDVIYEVYDVIITELLAALDQHRWIPVDERLPEKNAEYLGCIDNGNTSPFPLVVLHYGKGRGWATPNHVTHWKPIILPETGGKQNGNN
jgi:hypothetical protein